MELIKKQFLLIAALACAPALTFAQHTQSARPSPTISPPTPQQPRPAPSSQPPPGLLNLSSYGVEFEPDARLIVVMAALDAAGWDSGTEPTPFRQLVRRNGARLDPVLRARLQDFYTRHKLPGNRTPAEQAARYVSLAYTLGGAPGFDAPPRSDDLPVGVLDVLDFAPLASDFYRRAGIDEQLPEYLRAHRAEGDRLLLPTSRMVTDVLSYLHIQPMTTTVERVTATDPARANSKHKRGGPPPPRITVVREHARRFVVVPDLLAAPGAINFRVIGDDYYAIVPPGTDPASSELRRAYIQYLVDPLVLRFNRAIAAKRAEFKQLIDERRVAAGPVTEASSDVYLTVARSLVAAADARMSEAARLRDLQNDISARLASARTESERAAATAESRAKRARIEDASIAQLAEAYEGGAVLAFYFAEQLRGLETSGFDISNFFSDMIASVEITRERRRPAEYAAAVKRFREEREKARAAAATSAAVVSAPPSEQRQALIKGLNDVDQLVRLKNYEEAETRLRAMVEEFRGEPRVFYALGQVASVSAQDAFDETLQAERLRRALSFYRQAIMSASGDTDGALISRAHAASGRILIFLERKAEALTEFEAAIALGEVEGGAYREALNEKRKLTGQP